MCACWRGMLVNGDACCGSWDAVWRLARHQYTSERVAFTRSEHTTYLPGYLPTYLPTQGSTAPCRIIVYFGTMAAMIMQPLVLGRSMCGTWRSVLPVDDACHDHACVLISHGAPCLPSLPLCCGCLLCAARSSLHGLPASWLARLAGARA